jgi:hypothetical protein
MFLGWLPQIPAPAGAKNSKTKGTEEVHSALLQKVRQFE